MENFWNKKQIAVLIDGECEMLDVFWAQFGPVLLTWMYYQVGGDEQIAIDLTSEMFDKAVRNISQFNPTQDTLFQWLKQQAIRTRDEGLELRQLKPQRPWAWSQLPADVLAELAKLRSELVSEKTLDNPFVHEIVQAALAELEAADRELLMHRYNHLDTAGHIAEEMNCGVEEVQSRLYRCRHSFRRGFFQLISSANLGFNEASATGEVEILDANLEKLLSTTAMYISVDSAKTNSIRKRLIATVQEIRESQPADGGQHFNRVAMIGGGIILVVILIIAGIIFSTGKQPEPSTQPPAIATQQPDSQKEIQDTPEAKSTSQDDLDSEELKRIFALGQAGNIDALLEILKSGQFASQRVAAVWIGKLGDPSAIDLLQQAEDQWYPDSLGDNPFDDAIEQILTRFPDAVEPVIAQEPLLETKPDAKEEIPEVLPNIIGIVSNISNEPLANVKIELNENTLFSKSPTGRKLTSAKSNSEGQFQLTEAYEGAAFLTGRIQEQEAISVTRSVWTRKGAICLTTIGGKPALTGTVMVDGEMLSNQRLFLSDTLDISYASFEQEVTTDTNGNFEFLGVPPGSYTLMNKGFDNRIYRLGMFEMPENELYNVDLNIQTATVLLDYPAEPNGIALDKAFLAYAIGLSEKLHQEQAAFTEDGLILFDNVIPGTYILKVHTDSGIWIQQDVEIASGQPEQIVQVNLFEPGTAMLTGRFLGASPVDLFLLSANQEIRIDIDPKADGSYELPSVPNDVYSLATFVKGQLIEFMPIDLQDESETILDIDPSELMGSFSPLYVVTADATGLILTGAQCWLTEGPTVITTSSTGRGAFLAAPAGNYTLSVAYPGYPTENREIEIKSASLTAEPNSDNTVFIQFGVQ